jgi:hypothetical protein
MKSDSITSIMPVRVKRITAGTELAPSTKAGRTKCARLSSPETGKIGKVTANRMIMISPSQKFGTACADTATPNAVRSIQVLGLSAARIPSGSAIRMVTASPINDRSRVTGARSATRAATGLFQ